MRPIDEKRMAPQTKNTAGAKPAGSFRQQEVREPAEREMQCPVCGTPMPDLKGGKASLCPTCGFKDSCCF